MLSISNNLKVCDRCGKCCQVFTVQLGNTPSLVRDFLLTRGTIVRGKAGGPWLILPVPCRYLTEKGRCGIYSTRPEACRLYPALGDWRPDSCPL